MPVDTSIYAPKGPGQQMQNPLAMMGQMAQIQAAANQNKMFQQEFAARQALGPIYQQSIDPATGELDTNALMRAAAATPAAAWKTGELAAAATARQVQQLEIDQKKLAIAKSHADAMVDTFGALVANPNVSRQDVVGAVGRLIAQGRVTPQMAASELMNMPQGENGAPPTAAQLKPYLEQYLLRGLDAKTKIEAIYGTPQVINTGGAQQIVSTPSMGGAPQIRGGLRNTMSPGEAATPTEILMRNPDGTLSPANVTRSQFANLAGRGPVASAPAMTAQGLTPAQASQQVTVMDAQGRQFSVPLGVLYGQQAAAAAPSPAMPAASDGKPAGGAPAVPAGVQTGIGPAAAAAEQVSGQKSGEQGVNLTAIADQVPQRKADLQNMLGKLDSFESGPGAETTNTLKSFAGRFGLTPESVKEGVAAQEGFAKLAAQIAQAQSQSGTDARLSTAISANPGLGYSKKGNQQLIGTLLGNEDFISTKNQAWQNWLEQGNPPSTYGKFSTDFNKMADPRVFQLQYMDNAAKAKFNASLKGEDRAKFAKSLQTAVDNGWVQMPGAQ